MSSDRERLADYQSRLLDLLYASDCAVEARDAVLLLESESILAPVPKEQIDINEKQELDIRMVDMAIQLTKKWGVPKNE